MPSGYLENGNFSGKVFQKGKSNPFTLQQRENLKKSHKEFFKTHTHFRKGKSFENMQGERNPRWKGGRLKTEFGYIQIYQPNHPSVKTKRRKYVFEHRLVMEKYLGKYLEKWEVVHHINEIRDDNRLENLELCPNRHPLQSIYLLKQENERLKSILKTNNISF